MTHNDQIVRKPGVGVAAVVQSPKITRRIVFECLLEYISISIMYKVVVTERA